MQAKEAVCEDGASSSTWAAPAPVLVLPGFWCVGQAGGDLLGQHLRSQVSLMPLGI